MYCRDEDGDQPSELLGENGWYHRIFVRPATTEEAADILAQEEKDARRRALDQRRKKLFDARQEDGSIPAEPDLTGATRVDFGARGWRSLFQHWPDDELRVDEEAGVVWFLAYNGRDGDAWDRNNLGSFIARRFPLSEERRVLLADLRAEYEPESSA